MLLETPNAGGSSVNSEAISLEMLHATLRAQLWRTETQVRYLFRHSSIVDYVATYHGMRLGVSVTRAMKYKGEFGPADADSLLLKKLKGLKNASEAVEPSHAWTRRMLHIWAENEATAT